MVHRYFAATLGLFIVGIFLAVNKKQENTKNLRTLSGFLVFWVILQGVFGYLTVSLKLWPQVVTIHLLSGFVTTLIIWIIYFKAKDLGNSDVGHWSFNIKIKRLMSIGIVLVGLQIFLGAWTSTNYASLSCSDFPLCQGQILPPANFSEGFNFFQNVGPNYLGGLLDHESRVAIHLTHRLGALVVTVFLIYLIWSLYLEGLKRVPTVLAGVLVFQIGLGISNVIFGLPLLIAVAHNLGGLLLITCLSVLRFRD